MAYRMSDAARAARSKGGLARAASPNNPLKQLRVEPCEHCEIMRYTTNAQHWGHLGFAAVMDDNPTALHSLREKIARTGREDSRARWKMISR